jgi:hypothetical protein
VLCRAAVVSMITKTSSGSTVCASVAGAVIVTFLVAATTVRIGSAMGNVGLSSAPGGKAVIGSPSIMKRKVRNHASSRFARTRPLLMLVMQARHWEAAAKWSLLPEITQLPRSYCWHGTCGQYRVAVVSVEFSRFQLTLTRHACHSLAVPYTAR